MEKELITKTIAAIRKGDDFRINLFLNQYFQNIPFMEEIKEPILVIDNFKNNQKSCDDWPYLLDIEKRDLEVLLMYFFLFPIHKTNRIPLCGYSNDDISDIRLYKPVFETLINDEIKPIILITFSKKVGEYFLDYYEITFLEKFNEDIWKGFIKINKKYYFIYCLSNLDKTNIYSDKLSKFIMNYLSFTISEKINKIGENVENLILPDNLLDAKNIRDILKKDTDNYAFFPGKGKELMEIIDKIDDFDEYDLLIGSELNTGNIVYNNQNLTLRIFFEIRKKECAKTVCELFFDKDNLKNKLYEQKMWLISYYLDVNYTEKSFAAKWETRKQEMEDNLLLYQKQLKNVEKIKQLINNEEEKNFRYDK